MRDTVRNWLIRACWLGLFGSAFALFALRSGRPLYYSDGFAEHHATGLASAPMLTWRTPEPWCALPGPVVGRIAALPDGRLLYGRGIDEGDTDLVLFDPRRPDLPPEPLAGVNSPAHELSPAIGADGTLYFASDRTGGVGGFDLYRAARDALGYQPPMPVPGNSELDDSDPAVTADGVLVFVVSRPGGDRARLHRRTGERSVPLFEHHVGDERDPVFTPDGAALWFVRRVQGRVAVMASTRLADEFAVAAAMDARWGSGELRSPLLLPDHRLLLLRPGSSPILLLAEPQLLQPWWPGQWPLERLLLWCMALCALLLLLLYLGRRWHRLDMVTWCLLLSLLVHVLLYWLLREVALESEPLAGDDGGETIVTLVPSGGDGAVDGSMGDLLAREARFQPEQAALSASAPDSALQSATRNEAVAAAAASEAADYQGSEVAPSEVAAPAAALQDAAAQLAPRQGQDPRAEVAAAQLAAVPAVQQQAAAPERQSAAAQAAFTVVVPGASLQAAPPVARSAAGTGAAASELPAIAAPQQVAVEPVALQDGAAAGAAVTVRQGTDATSSPAAPVALAQLAPQGPATATQSPQRTAAAAAPVAAAVAPTSSTLPRAARRTPANGPAATPPPAVPAPNVAATAPKPLAAVALRDEPAPAAASARRAAGRDEAPRPVLAAALPVVRQGPPSTAATAAAPRRSTAPAGGVDLTRPDSVLARAERKRFAADERPAVTAVAQTPYSNRFGPAKVAALEQYGGTAATEAAVAAGLRYLARIQQRDGSWGRADLFDSKYGRIAVGKTGLCVLAFLGAGHVPGGDTEHAEVVARAIDYLLAQQDEDGAFGASSSYGHGITTYALAECYGMTRDQRLRPPLERALTWLLQHQGPRRDARNQGGWGYFSPGLEPEDNYARASITAWMVMALESAKLSGIELPPDVLPRAREYLERAFDRERQFFRYSHSPGRLRSNWPTLPASTPAAAFCLQLLGVPSDDEKITTASGYVLERRPQEYRRFSDEEFVSEGQGNVYFWYYATLSCFLCGGETWQQWNASLRELLPAAQDQDGSFPPIDVYARYAGDSREDRSYTTAMCVLSLEIYYRYFTPLLRGR